MKTTNRLDKSYGPAGAFAGMVLFGAGIVLTCFYFSGIVLILIGGFVGFTSTSVIIDEDKKRIKFSNNIFGIIPAGKWIQVVPGMTIGIKESTRSYRAYSQGNRTLDISKKDFRLILYDTTGKEIMQVKKTDSLQSAKAECDAIVNRLGLTRA